MGFRKRTEEEKLEKFGTTKVKDYAEEEALKGMIYAQDLREKHRWIRWIPMFVIGGIILLMMILL